MCYETAIPNVMHAGLTELELSLILGLGGIGFLIMVVTTIAGTIQKVLQTKHREQTRREVAAYVAEGTIKPDDAVRILEASERTGLGKAVREQLGSLRDKL